MELLLNSVQNKAQNVLGGQQGELSGVLWVFKQKDFFFFFHIFTICWVLFQEMRIRFFQINLYLTKTQHTHNSWEHDFPV